MARLTFLGHAAFRVEGGGLDGLIDPFLTGNSMTPFSPEDFKDVNFIFVTHGHGDHLGDTPAIAKRTGATVVATVEMCDVLKGVKCHPLQIGGAFTFPFGRVKMTPAWHGSGVQGGEGEGMAYGGVAGGFLLEVDGRRIYHAGDTGLTVEMGLLAEDGVDVALLPIGGNYTMDIDDAVRAVRMIKPRVAVPMHYNTFPLIKASPEEFASKASGLAEIRILKPGEILEV
ncbi:MAG: metal-dependent hydrolase [Synergistetes bacterium ADurb.Bin155]|jgi:L-ascorbate metabolism protein UlaG (beta-lactamase superfamily)|nr:metal-dependent hydrolase [Synergistales bacterium]MBP8996077.1 metal-dependent hydrolase [Synergistales bacterium]OQB46550.1 MAG: metal-dependent hydrolase [Synergistetes bacterium ADurb.Bin155]HOC82353.1 metal-dependent hydrolase [Synergistales bacterium]HQL01967.1 metal-dependent hydrolase [Synergistales bacterium]